MGSSRITARPASIHSRAVFLGRGAHGLLADLCIYYDCLSPLPCATMTATITTSAIAHQIAHSVTYIRPLKTATDGSLRHRFLRRNPSMFTPI
jgi:hypothetical protein